jgi:hypothetical protein
MSYRPGTSVISQALPTPRSAPTDTGVWLVAGLADAGPANTPLHCYNLADFTRQLGNRVSYSALYDALDVFFNEGGYHAIVSRIVGPSAVTATRNLLDSGSGISLVATAKGPGAGSDAQHGNNLKVAVLAGVVSGYRIQVLDSASVVLETSTDLTTQQDAVNWSTYSNYINLAIGATALVPATAAAAALSGGTDDRGNITETQRLNAINGFGAGLGPGQVSIIGSTTDASHQNLIAHALTYNRFALIDLPDTATAATLEASAVAARANGDHGAAFTPWVTAPGVIAGTIRSVPPSAFMAGVIARNDAINGNPNQPSAGERGQAQYITGLTQSAFDNDPATRQTLNSFGINVIRTMFGGIRNYGYRTLVDSVANPTWVLASNARLQMAIAADANEVAERHIFTQIDGAGVEIGHFNGDLAAMLLDYYNLGALYGITPNDAFYVNTGPGVNTPTTLAANELHAILNVKMSPMAEFVQIAVVKVPITGTV